MEEVLLVARHRIQFNTRLLLSSNYLVDNYDDIFKYMCEILQYLCPLNKMKSVYFLCILVLFLQSGLCVKQSDVGKNDWALNQIGEITNLRFIQSVNQGSSRLFFESSLGIFGHLNRKDGSILRRELSKTEKIIESNYDTLSLWTGGRQLIHYQKNSFVRSVDNLFINLPNVKLNSYIFSTKLYLGSTTSIWSFDLTSSVRNIQSANQINITEGYVSVKLFQHENLHKKSIYALLWNSEQQRLCLNSFQEQKLVERKCLNVSNFNTETFNLVILGKFVYFSFDKQFYRLNIDINSTQFIKISGTPLQYLHNGIVSLEGGKSYNPTNGKIEDIFRVQSNRRDINAIVEMTQNKLNFFEQKTKRALGTISLKNENQTKNRAQRIWINFVTEFEVQIYVQFYDLQFIQYKVNQSLKAQKIWSRQESLAYIQKILFMKYKGFTDNLNNPYHVEATKSSYQYMDTIQKLRLVPQYFFLRIKAQFRDIINQFISTFKAIKKFIVNNKFPTTQQELFEVGTSLKAVMGEDGQKQYGLRKYIIVITQKGTYYALDSKTSNIIWKKKNPSDRKLMALIKLKKGYEKETAIALTYKNGTTLLQEIQQNGEIITLKEFKTELPPTIHKISSHSLLVRNGMKIQQYDINNALTRQTKNYNFYEIDEESQTLIGWKNINNKLVQTWELKIPLTETIITTSAAYRGQIEARIPISNDKKVIFKNVDFSNFALLTMAQNDKNLKTGNLTLYLINGLTGTIQFSQYQTGVHFGLPINLVYDQNNAIVSYYSRINRVYQIWTVQGYQFPLQSQLLTKPYVPLVQKDDFMFRSKVFGTVLHINSIHVITSKQALLKRSIIVITQQMKLFLLNRDLISSRRPKSAEPTQNQFEGEFSNSKYPVDDYIMPLNPFGFLTHEVEIINLTKVRFSSTDLQSTIFIFAYGIDSFLIRIAPDKAFDMLDEEFNYIQLIAVLLGVTVIALVFKSMIHQAKLKKPHTE